MRLKFDFGKLNSNHHDWSDGKKGVTIYGPKLKIVILETLTAKGIRRLIGRRLWFYFPSGACWNFDVYLIRGER
jgi:hypothetical protein